MKRMLSMILTLALLLACLPAFRMEAHAATVASGTCGDNLTWTLDDAGTLTISGTGKMFILSDTSVPWVDYRSSVKKVVIHNGVTDVGAEAFKGCDNLVSVELPNSIAGIASYAFYGCTSLTNVEIPDSVGYIANYVFYGCTSLTNVKIPNSVYSISDYAFYKCTSLTEVEIPDSVTRLGEYVFCGCTSLTDVTIGNSITIIKDYAFYGCTSLTDLAIGNSVATIDDFAFSGCSSLTEVEIPDSVTKIGKFAFAKCTGLTKMEIPDSVTSIGDETFQQCTNLTDVTFGNSVTAIPSGMFRGCTSLENVKISDSVISIESLAFFKCTGLTKVEIPDSVTKIGNSAFKQCTNLSDIRIGASVDTIGFSAFSGCTSLTKVVIPNSVTTIYDNAFQDCTALNDLTLGNSISVIGGSSFSGCTSLTEVTIPTSVTEIGSYTFSECTGLKEITFKGDAPDIDDLVFRDVTATAYYPGDNVTWIEDVQQNYGGTITWTPYGGPVTLIASGTCGNNATWALDNAGTLTIFGTSNTFSYNNANETPWYPYYSSIKSVVVEDGINRLGSYLFADCTSLTSVTFGNSLNYIEGHVFQGCTGLTSVTFGNSICGIGDYAFQGCTGLTGLTIPDTVTSTGAYVFADCTGLSSVTFGNSLSSISSFMFANCTGLTSVTIPDSAKTINKSAFAGCTGLTSVTIGNSVEVIQENAFASCVNLREILFAGCAPTFKNQDGDGILYNVTATAYYPSVIDRWTEAVRQNYGGNITWVPYEREDVFIDSGACGLNLTWKLDTTGTLTISGTGDMYQFYTQASVPWNDYRQYVKTVIMEEGVTSIGYVAFRECKNLTSVTIPDSVTSIGEDAFYGCYLLTSVTIPDSVTHLGSDAFTYCTSLTSVTIGDSLKNVTGFYGCTSLTSITFGSSVETINGLAFKGCTSLVSLTLPDTVKTIGWYVFSDCTNLTSVKLGSSVETVGVGAFSDCTSLNEIIFTGNAPIFERNDNIDLGALGGIVATAYYPGNNDTWTEEVRQGSDGQITWVAYDAPEIEKFDIAFSQVDMGNALGMNFAFPAVEGVDFTGAYAEATMAGSTQTIPADKWTTATIGGKTHYVFGYSNIAAKQMADEVTIVIYNADGEAISNEYVDSIRGYVMRNVDKKDAESKALMVDMLNYGAAAQTYYGYNAEDLANAQLSEAQKAYGTAELTEITDIRVKGANYLGTRLELGSSIGMQMNFVGTTADMYAVIEFTNHSGKKISERVAPTEISGAYLINITQVAVADGRIPVTVTVYNADGSVYGSATDSMASYIARMSNADALYECIMKFSDSAYAYLH